MTVFIDDQSNNDKGASMGVGARNQSHLNTNINTTNNARTGTDTNTNTDTCTNVHVNLLDPTARESILKASGDGDTLNTRYEKRWKRRPGKHPLYDVTLLFPSEISDANLALTRKGETPVGFHPTVDSNISNSISDNRNQSIGLRSIDDKGNIDPDSNLHITLQSDSKCNDQVKIDGRKCKSYLIVSTGFLPDSFSALEENPQVPPTKFDHVELDEKSLIEFIPENRFYGAWVNKSEFDIDAPNQSIESISREDSILTGGIMNTRLGVLELPCGELGLKFNLYNGGQFVKRVGPEGCMIQAGTKIVGEDSIEQLSGENLWK